MADQIQGKNMKFKSVEWVEADSKYKYGDNIICYSENLILNDKSAIFTIWDTENQGVIIMDDTDTLSKTYRVESIELAKIKAQSLFESYCKEIIRNICD